MKSTKQILNIIIAFVLCLFQQSLLIGFGILAFGSNYEILAYILWTLCLPMLILNRLTFRYISKYGILNFLSAESDTSEIDVKKEDRFYYKPNNPE